MIKTIKWSLFMLCLFTSYVMFGQFYPEKPEDLSNHDYEKYTKKLKSDYASEDHYGTAFYLAALKAPKHKVEVFLNKAVEENPEEVCEKIFTTQMLADLGFYKVIYRYDTLLFQKAFNQCLGVLGENAFELYMEEEDKKAEAHQKTLPQIDSAKMDIALIKTLEQIYVNDQKYRKKIDILKNTEEENDRFWKKMEELDAINLVKVDSILKNVGCPTPATVGYELFRSIFLVLHHQADITIRKKYRNVIEEHFPGGTLDLYDRRTSDLESSLKFETMDERVDKCLEDAEIEEIEILVEGELRNVISHNIDETCIIGALLPAFETTDLNNKAINTQSLNGEVNVINFWFTQCRPCIKEMPFLNTLVDQYEDQRVNFVAFNRDAVQETEQLLAKQQFKFQIIPNAGDLIKNKMKMIWGYPLTIVTDKQNKVVATFGACLDKTCEEELKQTIEKHLLAEHF